MQVTLLRAQREASSNCKDRTGTLGVLALLTSPRRRRQRSRDDAHACVSCREQPCSLVHVVESSNFQQASTAMGGDRKRFKLSPQSKRVCDGDSSRNLLCALRDSQTSPSQRYGSASVYHLEHLACVNLSFLQETVGTHPERRLVIEVVASFAGDPAKTCQPAPHRQMLCLCKFHPGCVCMRISEQHIHQELSSHTPDATTQACLP